MEQQVPKNPNKINPSDVYELNYWTSKFKLTADELREIVKDLGTSAKAMEAYLRLLRNGLIKNDFSASSEFSV
jgi:hypothetical protein